MSRLRLGFALAALGALPLAAQTPPETAPASLTLEQAREIAAAQHPQVEIASLRQQIAGQNVVEARAGYLPAADAYADAVEAGNANTRLLAGGLNNPVIYDRTADGLAISQLITDFGRTSNRIAGAKLSAKAEAEAAAATRETVALNVEANYYRTLQAEAVLRAANEAVQAQDVQAQRIRALAAGNLRSQLDVRFAEVGLEQARLLEQSAEGAAENAQASLSVALGYRRTHHFTLSAPSYPTEPPAAKDDEAAAEAAVDQALQERPDLRQLRFQQQAADRNARAEHDRNFPIVSAVGTIGNAITHDNRLPNKYAAGGITVDLPLFAGGATVARERIARLQEREAEETLRQAEDNTSREVRTAWNNLRTARQRAATSDALLAHARDALELANARYRAGAVSIVELNQAQLNATSAEIGAAGARYDAMIADSVLRFATGTLR